MHWVISLLDTPVILLQPIIAILLDPMYNFFAHHLTYCTWIGAMPMEGMAGWPAKNADNPAEEVRQITRFFQP
jgi:hypothetical protein